MPQPNRQRRQRKALPRDLEARPISEYFIKILDLYLVVAVHYEWRSHSWQQIHAPAVINRCGASVRAFPTTPAAPLIEIASRRAFFNMSLAFLKFCAQHLGHALPGGASPFDALFGLCRLF